MGSCKSAGSCPDYYFPCRPDNPAQRCTLLAINDVTRTDEQNNLRTDTVTQPREVSDEEYYEAWANTQQVAAQSRAARAAAVASSSGSVADKDNAYGSGSLPGAPSVVPSSASASKHAQGSRYCSYNGVRCVSLSARASACQLCVCVL